MIEILVVKGKIDPSSGTKKKFVITIRKKGHIKKQCYKLQNKFKRHETDHK